MRKIIQKEYAVPEELRTLLLLTREREQQEAMEQKQHKTGKARGMER